jgi:hypothetical protein
MVSTKRITARQERFAVVRYLMAQAAKGPLVSSDLVAAANAIINGEHHKEKK